MAECSGSDRGSTRDRRTAGHPSITRRKKLLSARSDVCVLLCNWGGGCTRGSAVRRRVCDWSLAAQTHPWPCELDMHIAMPCLALPYSPTYIHTYTHTYIHTYTHTYIHIISCHGHGHQFTWASGATRIRLGRPSTASRLVSSRLVSSCLDPLPPVLPPPSLAHLPPAADPMHTGKKRESRQAAVGPISLPTCMPRPAPSSQ